MDMNVVLTTFIFWILPIIIGIGIYYSPRRYPSVITRIDRFASWIHKKREGIKEDKGNKYLKYIKYIVYVPFDVLLKLTERVENKHIRSGTRVTLSIYLSYFVFAAIVLIAYTAIVIAAVLVVFVLVAVFLALYAAGSTGKTIKQDGRTYRENLISGWVPDKDFLGNEKVERDFFGNPKIERDFFGNQKIEKDFLGNPIVPPKEK